MKNGLALAIAGLLVLGACSPRDETGRVGGAEGVDAADTLLPTQQQVDTAIVTRDTTVEVDTTDAGGGVVGRDTINP